MSAGNSSQKNAVGVRRFAAINTAALIRGHNISYAY
jgi:hypothetical protein